MIVKSAGIIPVKQTIRGWEFLLLRAYSYYDFPKGRVEEGEKLLDAALREAKEEAGINSVNFKWGLQYIETDIYKTKVNNKKAKKISCYFLAEYESGKIEILPNPETGRVEHHQFIWLTYEEIKEKSILSDRISKVLDWANDIISTDVV